MVAAETNFSTCCCADDALLRLGLLKYIANPTMTETTAIAINNALKLSLFIVQVRSPSFHSLQINDLKGLPPG
jgi:hypothetical protein